MFRNGRPVVFILIAMLSIQAGASIAKGLFPQLGAVGATALRITFAALILLTLWRPWRPKWTADELRRLALYGTVLGLMNLAFYLAIERIPLGIAVALEFTGPLTMAVLYSRRPVDILWAILAAIGIGQLLIPNNSSPSLNGWGIGYGLGAGFFWALYIFFGKRAGASLHGGHAAALGMFFAAVIVLPVALIGPDHRFLIPFLWPMAIVMALLSSALPYSLEMIALNELPTITFSILMSLEPAIAAIAGWLLLKENLSVAQGLAIGSVIIASIGSSFGSPAPPLPDTPS
jgi:inner membrane transporter RhtA